MPDRPPLRILAVCFVLSGWLTLPGLSAPPPPDKEVELCAACWSGDMARVISLVGQGAPLDQKSKSDSLHRTPLMCAAYHCAAAVQFLLARGASITEVDENGDTAFSIAAKSGNLPGVQALLAAGSDLNWLNNDKDSPLVLAARGGHDDVITFLLAHHALQNAGGPLEEPLWYAVHGDHLSTAKILLAAGEAVSFSESARKVSPTFETTMGAAAHCNDAALIDLLVEHGGDINETGSTGRSAFFTLMQNTQNVDLAARLLARGANPNLADNHGDTPFTVATSYANFDIVKLLVEHGANINARNNDGLTALMMLCQSNAAKRVQILLTFHPDTNLRDKAGETAWTYAADRGGVQIDAMLQAAGAHPGVAHIIAKEPSDPLSPPQAWALAVGAIYSQSNGFSQYSLRLSSDNLFAANHILQNGWNIANRDQLLARVADLEKPDRESDFMSEELGRVFALAILNPYSAERQEKVMAKLLHDEGDHINVAWDCCRAANLLRCGVTVGYVTASEAWPLLLANARQVQQAYGSWEEMNAGFLESREIYANKPDPGMRACAALLLSAGDPNSPWNNSLWNTNLERN